MILFLRRCDDISLPFYTIEVKGRKVVQLKGMSNEAATPEVQAFINRWTAEVLQGNLVAA